jgi:hypothetical protein
VAAAAFSEGFGCWGKSPDGRARYLAAASSCVGLAEVGAGRWQVRRGGGKRVSFNARRLWVDADPGRWAGKSVKGVLMACIIMCDGY